jgi:hypothetical protein
MLTLDSLKKLGIDSLTDLLDGELKNFSLLKKNAGNKKEITTARVFIEQLLAEIELREAPLPEVEKNIRIYAGLHSGDHLPLTQTR